METALNRVNARQALLVLYTCVVFMVVMTLASALSIESPGSTVEGLFVVRVTSPQLQEGIVFSITPGFVSGSCTGCSSLERTVTLAPGTYTLQAASVLGKQAERKEMTITVLGAQQPISVNVSSPLAQTYFTSFVPLVISTSESVDNLSYELNGQPTPGCERCSKLTSTLNPGNGDHLLTIITTHNGFSARKNISFSIDALPQTTPEALELIVHSPLQQRYEGAVQLSLSTNAPATIRYLLDGEPASGCMQCMLYSESKTLRLGPHILIATATNGNESARQTVSFSVVLPPPAPKEEDDEEREEKDNDDTSEESDTDGPPPEQQTPGQGTESPQEAPSPEPERPSLGDIIKPLVPKIDTGNHDQEDREESDDDNDDDDRKEKKNKEKKSDNKSKENKKERKEKRNRD